jgi:hypothetical protein
MQPRWGRLDLALVSDRPYMYGCSLGAHIADTIQHGVVLIIMVGHVAAVTDTLIL